MDLSFARIKRIIYRLFFLNIGLPYKKWRIKKKPTIKVVFLLTDVGKWKTESLYLKMNKHPRFLPILAVTPVQFGPDVEASAMKKYLIKKKYDFIELSINKTICKSTKADIIFYQEPYYNYYYPKHDYRANLKALSCYVNYAFHSISKDYANYFFALKHAYQVYYENNISFHDLWKSNPTLAKRVVVTGLPIMDNFLFYKNNEEENPWPKDVPNKKKIIWAPHHTIPGKGSTFLSYSTFLDYYETMLELAIKYKDYVFFAFKPHPVLKSKLLSIWTQEKIDSYYHQWEIMDNTMYTEGEYCSLFMNSDAMIHDCSSFQIEYHYTLNPVLYLCKDVEAHKENLNTFAQKAFDCHYIGKNVDDIEKFIQNVIKGIDPMKDERKAFYNDNLLLPYGKSASGNIINAILGN